MIFKAKEIARSLPLEKKILGELILVDKALDLGLGKILINPKLKTAQKEIINTVLSSRVSAPIINLTVFLAEEKRLNLFKKILPEFQRLLESKKRAVRAEITTIAALSPAELAGYQKKLESKSGTEVLLENKVDSQILGGAIIKIGGKTIDNSYRTRLKALK